MIYIKNYRNLPSEICFSHLFLICGGTGREVLLFGPKNEDDDDDDELLERRKDILVEQKIGEL